MAAELGFGARLGGCGSTRGCCGGNAGIAGGWVAGAAVSTDGGKCAGLEGFDQDFDLAVWGLDLFHTEDADVIIVLNCLLLLLRRALGLYLGCQGRERLQCWCTRLPWLVCRGGIGSADPCCWRDSLDNLSQCSQRVFACFCWLAQGWTSTLQLDCCCCCWGGC